MPPDTPRSWFPPFKRLPHGQIGVDREFAMLIALLFWVLVLGLYASFARPLLNPSGDPPR
jgi:hypothetical protein